MKIDKTKLTIEKLDAIADMIGDEEMRDRLLNTGMVELQEGNHLVITIEDLSEQEVEFIFGKEQTP